MPILLCVSAFFKVAVALGVIGTSVDPTQIDKHGHVKLHLRLLDQFQLARQAHGPDLHLYPQSTCELSNGGVCSAKDNTCLTPLQHTRSKHITNEKNVE